MTAVVEVPGSKSYTNRALIMAALTKGPVELQNPLYSDDTEAMIGCLRTLGLSIETKPDSIVVQDDISSVKEGAYELFARDSGTTARFILALSCLVPGVKTLRGNHRLNERPIEDLVQALCSLGAKISYSESPSKLPLCISSNTLSQNTVHLKSDISSQFCSALLLIAPLLPQGLTLHLANEPISKPYIEMSLQCMRDWGIAVCERYVIPPNQQYSQKRYAIEGDFSSAGYFFARAVLTRSTITVENLSPTSKQADRKFVDILVAMGNRASYQERSVRLEGMQLTPLDISMEDCPDQVMTMAVLAAFAKGTTVIRGVRSLRVKESDRIFALKKELGKMGIHTEDTHDTLTIHGGTPKAAAIETYNDHRVAMAFAVASARLPGLIIQNPEVVSKTFPAFWTTLEKLQ